MKDEVLHLLVERAAARAGLSADHVDLDAPFDTYGFTSVDVVTLSAELEDLLDRDLPPTVLWQYPTIRELTAFLDGDPAHSPARPDEAATGTGARTGPYVEADLAIVGLGCRLPGGITTPVELWELLRSGVDAVGTVPDGRWDAYRDASPGHAAAVDRVPRHGSFLSDEQLADFDAEFFGISPAEAAAMDPQQRILLEVAWEALEHAGLPADRPAAARTGVYVGACNDDHGRAALEDLPSITARSGTGAAMSIIANRLSYALDLRGPSMTVDTACSSSLVALHLARRGLLAGECDTALVGGVNLLLSPGVTLNFADGGVLSPGGRCRPFSATADGYVRGEGCLVVVVRKLDNALREGDRVLAVLRATGTNQDGRSNGLMAPNPAAQESLIREVWADSGLDPAETGYVEAHGTGTPLGDPIEASALGAALGGGRSPASPLLVGSVKSNLGHLEGAAGLLGLVKCVLALHHGLIPPTLHHDAPNPRIPLAEWGLAVVDRPLAWPHGGRPRTAGVSSFGFGGANAHAVLVEAPLTQTLSIPE